MKKNIKQTLSCALICLAVIAMIAMASCSENGHSGVPDTELVIKVKTPGSLAQEIHKKGLDSTTIERLTLEGKLNSADIICLRQMIGLSQLDGRQSNGKLNYLDLTKVSFRPDRNPFYINTMFGKMGITASDTLPPCMLGSLADCVTTLKTIKLPTSVESIGFGAFMNCNKLKNVNIPDNITSIESSAFMVCFALTDIRIPEGMDSIEEHAFNGAGLIHISLPNTLKKIGHNAFANCQALRDITIPASVSKIGAQAFDNCIALTTVTMESPNPSGITMKDDPFFINPSYQVIRSLYVPAGSIVAYSNIEIFKDTFGKNIFEIK